MESFAFNHNIPIYYFREKSYLKIFFFKVKDYIKIGEITSMTSTKHLQDA